MSEAAASGPKKLWLWVGLLLLIGLLVPNQYPFVEARLTGERITVQVDECHVASSGRGSGWRCTAYWTLSDGRVGHGTLWGLDGERPAGSHVTVYATREHAVTPDSWLNLALFAMGTAALIALAWLVIWRYLAGRRYRSTPPHITNH